MEVSDLRVMGRATQGVRLINIKGNDSIAAVTKVMKEDEEEVIEGEFEAGDDITDVTDAEETSEDATEESQE
jgi:DNA gyrase subunit A